MVAAIVAAHLAGAWQGESVGLITEMATLLTFAAGAVCYCDCLPLAAPVGIATAVLLSLKREMHASSQRVTREDVYTSLKFAVITVIVLPVLPNRGLGPSPLNLINSQQIWLMVILISGISFLSYVLIWWVGSRQGISLTGLLGGIVSSTPVTISFARHSRDGKKLARPLALAITVAWAITYVRVLVHLITLNRQLPGRLWTPLAAALLAGTGLSSLPLSTDARSGWGAL